jgi:signal transduction histidine kinase
MKLLTRISLRYIAFSFIAFVLSGIIFSNIIRSIFYTQIDENMQTEKLLIEWQIKYSDSIPDFRLVFGHLIDVTVYNSPRKSFEIVKDTMLYDRDRAELSPHRCLIARSTTPDLRGYLIKIFLPLDQTETLIRTIIIALTILFLVLLALLIYVNYFISRSAWNPFYRTLENLSHFDITANTPLHLQDTEISEFQQLNKALDSMSRKLQQDYRSLKEFNENASHEIQTPLAIIKSKLELLLQNESLNEEQVRIIKSVYEATNRMSRLNQGLLLISKIDNNQFPDSENININHLVEKSLEHFGELISLKKLKISVSFNYPVETVMNRALAEILISNLLSNSIRHNIKEGTIEITTGPGILHFFNSGHLVTSPPEELFERFRKSGASSDSIGLGLAIVKKILQIYNYSILYSVDGTTHHVKVNFIPEP